MIEKSESYSGCITYHSITVLMCYLEIAKTIFFLYHSSSFLDLD